MQVRARLRLRLRVRVRVRVRVRLHLHPGQLGRVGRVNEHLALLVRLGLG